MFCFREDSEGVILTMNVQSYQNMNILYQIFSYGDSRQMDFGLLYVSFNSQPTGRLFTFWGEF